MSLRIHHSFRCKAYAATALALCVTTLAGSAFATDQTGSNSNVVQAGAPAGTGVEPVAQPTPGVSSERIAIEATATRPGNPLGKGDVALRLVQRSTTGKVAAAFTAIGVLTGTATSGFRKEDLKGTKIEAIPNPALDALSGAIRSRLDAYFQEHKSALPVAPIMLQIEAGEWLLVYQKLSDADTPYELRFNAKVSVPPKKVGFLKFERSAISMDCQPEPEPKAASLSEWQADDYALVNATARAYVEQCAERFAQALPGWFPETATSLPLTTSEQS